MILMAGHKPWSGIKTKMTPEMKFGAMVKAESLVQEILTQKIDEDRTSLSEDLCHHAEECSENEVQTYMR